ncbi:MAG: (2Fe-2S)-binding protein [Methylophilaceae bacterium]
MYVCVCMAITERQVHQAANNGARTLKDLKRELGVASQCGSCAGCAKQCLREANQSNLGLLATACA